MLQNSYLREVFQDTVAQNGDQPEFLQAVLEVFSSLEPYVAIHPELQANALNKQQRRKLIELLKAFPVQIRGKRPVEEAIITSGGVKVSQIDPKTMASKLVEGLYFAGEIIDCDAYTGGFNLQIAWATGYAAGSSVGNDG